MSLKYDVYRSSQRTSGHHSLELFANNGFCSETVLRLEYTA